MQALMLAAGIGSRLRKYTEKQPKCLVDVGGKTIFDRIIEALRLAKINRFIIVVGYRSDMIIDYATQKYRDFDFVFIVNDEYASTNNIYSLWLAKEEMMKDDTVLLESDLIFDNSLISDMVSSPDSNLAAVARYEQWMDGTVATIASNGYITDFIGKRDFSIDSIEKYYKTVNIYKFSKTFSNTQLFHFLDAFVESYGNNWYYEEVLKAIVAVSGKALKAYVTGSLKWYEIDNQQDLDIADTMFAPAGKMLSSYGRHYGGYWRYSKVKDFCYLVNPYFPTKALKEKIKYFFDDLLACYPSGLNEQRSNAGMVFNINEEYTAIGNGASEIILGLGKILSGSLLVFIPTFNEYIRCFHNCKVNHINMAAYDFRFDTEHILSMIEETDILAIINPDNPSGAFIPQADMMRILDKCHDNRVTCIIDESFIDFAESSVRYTLLTDSTLEKYPNLIVVKSISKSYGVPGLRLGVAACSDKRIVNALIQELAIWNINSYAEYFFQIFHLYRDSYFASCDKLVESRTAFVAELNQISFLEVHPSQANYLLCEVTGKYDAEQLGEILISHYDILIKILTSKTGFNGRQFIRIAVRNKSDNKIIVNALQKLDK